ncbi:hypothetical protein LAD74_00670 [Mycoplasma sp. U97]|uniref:MAG3090 family protein n=1 Tax=Mycoplasma tauri TaxID=547987 RepID=UPI001CBFE60D|nr:hypothetical protein [Mycoplasma tauri]MBZ4212512.1 hypothetical protein [Mycoplasma tauri]
MKRLNCTYEVKKDKEFPWLLKHPKVKNGLAKFKNRNDALEWYMLLHFETAIWFQDDKRIFAGQLTIDSEDDKWYYYVKTASFDGDATYEGICSQLGINPFNFKRDPEYARKRGNEIVEGRDFILISDPYTYFPENLEITKRTQKDVIDVESIRLQFQKQYEILMSQMHENNKIADEELELLKAELAKKDIKFEELANKLELLKQSKPTLQGVEYVQFSELADNDTVGALALYIEKIKKIIEKINDNPSSVESVEKIKENIRNFESALIAKKSSIKDEKTQKIIEKLHNEFSVVLTELLEKIKINSELENSYQNQVFYTNENNKLVPVDWELSFVLVDLKHVGFVSYENYHYSIPYLAIRSKYSVTLVDNSDSTQTMFIPSVNAPMEEQKMEQHHEEEKEDVAEFSEIESHVVEEEKEEEEEDVAEFSEIESDVVEEEKEETLVEEPATTHNNELEANDELAPIDYASGAAVVNNSMTEYNFDNENQEWTSENNEHIMSNNDIVSDASINDQNTLENQNISESSKEITERKSSVLYNIAITLLSVIIVAIIVIAGLAIADIASDSFNIFKGI